MHVIQLSTFKMFADFIPTFFFILEHILFDLTRFEVAVTLQYTQLNQISQL